MDIVNRLKLFMDSESIGSTQFADACKIPRPTLSQILSGRNKKISDEVISKIHEAYPRLSVLWLLLEKDLCPQMQITKSQNPKMAVILIFHHLKTLIQQTLPMHHKVMKMMTFLHQKNFRIISLRRRRSKHDRGSAPFKSHGI